MLDAFIPAFSSAQVAALCAVAFVAGLARGFSGFGSALIFVPVASALVGPRLAAVVILIIDFAGALGMVPDAWRRADRPEVYRMTVGALVGIPLGAWVLGYSDPTALRWGVALVVLAMLCLLASGWRYRGRPSTPLAIVIGSAAGFFSGAAQVGGPPVVAYWLGGVIDHRTARANIVLYFALSSLISIAAYLAGGLFALDAFKLAVFAGPAFILGVWLGARMFGRADEQFFRRICFMLIALAAVIGMPLWQ